MIFILYWILLGASVVALGATCDYDFLEADSRRERFVRAILFVALTYPAYVLLSAICIIADCVVQESTPWEGILEFVQVTGPDIIDGIRDTLRD